MRAPRIAIGITLFLCLSLTIRGGFATARAGTSAVAQQGAPPRAQPQTARQGTGSITGRVVAADNGRTLRLAHVQLLSPGNGPPRTATTDVNGQYSFTDLPAGRYTLVANNTNGYLTQEYGQLRDFETGSPIELADNQHLERIDFALSRGGAITGRIIDDYGDGISRVRVDALRLQYGPGGLSVTTAGTSYPTDDLGQFRVFGLTPGDYLVRATAPGNSAIGFDAMTVTGDAIRLQSNLVALEASVTSLQAFVAANRDSFSDGIGAGSAQADTSAENYAPMYFPGVTTPSNAIAITVERGQDAVAHFGMPIVRFASVSGAVIDSQGRPFRSGSVQLLSTGAIAIAAGTAVPIRGDGSFVVNGLPPGDYTLEFRTDFFPNRNSVVELAMLPLSVDGRDLTGIVLSTAPGGIVSGRLQFEGQSPPDLSRVTVNAVSPGNQPRANMGPAFTRSANAGFQLHGIAGAVLFRASAPAGWTLKRVTLQGRDITDVPYEFRGGEDLSGLEIVLTDRTTTVSGSVRDGRGQALKEYAVVVLPEDLPRGAVPNRFVRTIRPDREGRYSALGLPPGNYLVAAFPSVAPTREWDPRLQAIVRAGATRLSLAEGQSAILDLPIWTPPR